MRDRGTGTRAWANLLASRLAPALTAVAVVVAGCGSGSGGDVPEALVDGSPARTLDLHFEGVDAPVLRTRRRSLDLPTARADSRLASCLHANWSSLPAEPVVHRVGISGESVTFQSLSGHTLQACDGAGHSAASKAWCGLAFGRTVGGLLRDPRLDLGGCRTDDGDAIAFLWVEPGPGTRFVVVDRGGFSEAYEVDGDLPVRVAVTERVDVAGSRAVVRVSEHSSTGRLLRRRELEAVVSG